MAIEPALPDEKRDRLDEVVTLCRRRIQRSETRLAWAQSELAAARVSLAEAERELAQHLAENPDPQISLI